MSPLPIRGRARYERDLHRHRAARLYEDATADREVRALDTAERDLEDRLPVIGVGLEHDALPTGLPFAEHADAAAGTGDLRFADEQMVAVVHRLEQRAHRPVRRTIGQVRHVLDDDHDST